MPTGEVVSIANVVILEAGQNAQLAVQPEVNVSCKGVRGEHGIVRVP